MKNFSIYFKPQDFILKNLDDDMLELYNTINEYMKNGVFIKSWDDLTKEDILSLFRRSDEEVIINKCGQLSTRQKKILSLPLFSDIYNTKSSYDTLEELIKENNQLKLENTELKHYRDYYKAVFADIFNDKYVDDVYFYNLKELFVEYMVPDEELNEKAIPLKYQLYALVIFLANYIKNDEFYGTILRSLLKDDSSKYVMNDKILSVLDDDNHKLLKDVIIKNEIKEYK